MVAITASIALPRVVDLRHTAPMLRDGAGFPKGLMRRPRAVPTGEADGEFGQQRDAVPGGDHLAQRLEAGGAVVLLLAQADAAADLECLVAQAVAVLEQQQALALEVRHPDAVVRGEPMGRGHGEHERLLVQRRLGEALGGDRQRQDAEIDLAVAQLLEQRAGLVLVQHQLEAGQGPAQRPHDVRQQVGPHRRDQRQLAAARRAGRDPSWPPRRSRRPPAARAARARTTFSPVSVSVTRFGRRSTSGTPRYSSSLRTCAESVGWLTKQRSAARPKCRSSARATR